MGWQRRARVIDDSEISSSLPEDSGSDLSFSDLERRINQWPNESEGLTQGIF